WCGKGVAMRAKGLGAEVIVTEIDPIKAMEAVMDGFKVMPMREAAKIGDFFVTVTGCADVIGEEAFLNMKDGAICCNAGHFDVEVNMAKLREIAVDSYLARNNIMGYKLANGKTVFIIAEGRLVNLAAGDGHPAEIMDMSFAIQALSALHVVKNKGNLGKDGSMTVNVPAEVDREVALRKIASWGIEIDKLTPEQEKYLNGWEV
ncbi:MAG: adenosylhomocysteinase, partial [Oscillospiraceae bacterium]|nr:adenosylhomocysteinase [Oscillospiraceae bacterium]